MLNRCFRLGAAVALVLPLCAGALYPGEEAPDPTLNKKEATDNGNRSAEEEYIKKYPRSFTARATLSYAIMDLDLVDRKFANRTIRYMRDEDLYAGVSVYYKNFGIGSRIGVMDTKNQRRKKVEDFDLTAHYYSPAFGVELLYRQYGWFYVTSSPYGVGKLWNALNDGLRMKSESAGINMFLFIQDIFTKDIVTLNKNFSYGAAFEQTEKQVKSGGAALVEISGNYHRMRNNIPIIPVYAHELFMYMTLYGLRGWQIAGFGIGVGLAYTIVLPRDFFISALLSLSFRPSWRELYTFPYAKREFRIDSLRGKGKIYIGYNADSFFTGVSFIFEGIITPCYTYKAETWSGDLSLEFFAGVRI